MKRAPHAENSMTIAAQVTSMTPIALALVLSAQNSLRPAGDYLHDAKKPDAEFLAMDAVISGRSMALWKYAFPDKEHALTINALRD